MACRIVESGDALLAQHNVAIGDFIIDPSDPLFTNPGEIYIRYDWGLNPADGLPYSNPVDRNTVHKVFAALAIGKAVLVDCGAGVDINSINIFWGLLEPSIFTETNGHLYIKNTNVTTNVAFGMYGLQNCMCDFKYVNGTSGDANYLGHDAAQGTAFTSGQYGAKIDRAGLRSRNIVVFEGDDKGESYGDSRYYAYRPPKNTGMKYAEWGNGGFTATDIKETPGYQDRIDGITITDCYIHDSGGEGVYIGNNAIDIDAAVLTNFLFQNTRILRAGTENVQFGMLGNGSRITNCVIAFSATQWKNNSFAFVTPLPGGRLFQSGQLQLVCFDGNIELDHCIILGGGGSIVALNGSLTTYTDNTDTVVTGSVHIHHCLFWGGRDQNNIYLSQLQQGDPGTTNHLSIEINNCYFGNHRNDLSEVDSTAPTTKHCITNNNDITTINIHDNVHDASYDAFFNDQSSNPNITLSNNVLGSVPEPRFILSGLPDGHDPRNMEFWEEDVMYLYPEPPDGEANEPITYEIGDWVYRYKKFFEATSQNSLSRPPSANWNLKTFTPITGVPTISNVSVDNDLTTSVDFNAQSNRISKIHYATYDSSDSVHTKTEIKTSATYILTEGGSIETATIGSIDTSANQYKVHYFIEDAWGNESDPVMTSAFGTIPAASAPVYEDNGGIGAASSAAPSIPYPATVNANDILIIQVVNGINTSFNTPTDWAKMAYERSYGGATMAYFWKRATGSESGSVSMTAGTYGNQVTGVMSRFSGCVTSGNPYNVTATDDAVTTAPNIPAITTTTDNSLCVALLSIEDNSTLSGWDTYTSQFNIPDSTGGRSRHNLSTYEQSTAGAVAADLLSQVGTDHWATLVMALVPA